MAALERGLAKWFKNEGIDVELVPNAGSIDCVKNVATRELAFSLPGAEALAAGRAQGLKTRVYYTTYQGNVYGIAVPAEGTVQSMEHRYIKQFSRRTKVRRSVYENVVARWSELGFEGVPPKLWALED